MLLLFAVLMAAVSVGAYDQWPITITRADGLPGSQLKFDNTIAKNIYRYRSPLMTFEEPVDRLRLTVCATTATESATASYSGRAGKGPGFPYFTMAELGVYGADGAPIPFELSANAVAPGASLEVLCDNDSMTYYQSTSSKGSFDGNYHYIELKFEAPVSSFSVRWSSHPMSTSNLPTFVGLTPGTDYMPCSEQNLTVEKVASPNELSDTDALFVLEGHSPEWEYDAYGRTHPGGGFFEAPCLTTAAPSPFGIFSLVPIEGKKDAYKVKYLNMDRYIAKPTSRDPGEVLWTSDEDEAADITFEQLEDGNFELKMIGRSLLIVQNAYMRMTNVERLDDGSVVGCDVPFSPVFTLYKANVRGAAFAPRLQAAVDDARARLAAFGPCFSAHGEDEDVDDELVAAVEVAEKRIADPSVTYSAICDAERLLNNEVINYTIEYSYLKVDTINYICDLIAKEKIRVSSAPDWQRGTYPADMEMRLDHFATDMCQIIDYSGDIEAIDAAIARLDAAVEAFWASRIQYVEEFPFMAGTPADKLPGKLASYGGYVWESPIYYLKEAVQALRFTVVSTDGPTKYLGYDVPSIAEFELYDNLGNKIAITEDMITMNSLTTFGGSSLKALVDGKETTFARGAFDAGRADVYGYADDPQFFYIDIQLKEPINCFRYVQKGYRLGEENPMQFVFGEYGVKAVLDSVAYSEKYAVAGIEKITDISQITDDGIYAIFGLDDCDKVNCAAGEGGFYADARKLSATFNTQCAYTIKSAGDGRYYIRSLSSGAYWGRTETAFAKKSFRSEASQITIAPRNVGNFSGSFAIYEHVDDSSFPYLVYEDWSGELGINPLASLEECEFDGQCDWYIYRVDVDGAELLALDAVISSAKELGIAVSNDPGCFAGMSAFTETLAAAEAVAAAADSEAAPLLTERLDAAVESARLAEPNPVVEGIYVIENAMERFGIIAGSKMAISCAKDELNPDIYIYRWEESPMGAAAIDSSFCFELISAAGSAIVDEWLTFGTISAEDAKNAFYIRNVGTGLYIADTETMDVPLGTSAAPEQTFIVKYSGKASFRIFNPSAVYKSLYAYNHQDGSGTIGYVVYDVTENDAARWNLRLLSANATAIDSPQADGDEVVSVTYYSPAGVASDAPLKGFNIVKRLYRNGVVKSEKIYVK